VSDDELPMMPFMVKDWIAATMHWPCAERGAYISFLAFQWVNKFLPAEDVQLARIAGIDLPEFERVWSTVGAKFEADERGLFNIRLEEHRKKALRLRDAHTRGASTANAVRRAKRHARHSADCIAERSAQHDAPVTPLSPSPSPSPSPVEEINLVSSETTRRTANAQRVSRGTRWDEDQWLNFKLEYPHRGGGQPWTRAIKACKARLLQGHTWQEIIEGAKRYSAYIRAAGKEGTEIVMHASTFLGPDKRFLEDWDVPAEAGEVERWSPTADEEIDPPAEAATQ
jgi:uncharacterized protein YdaU (DUF1376 family)